MDEEELETLPQYICSKRNKIVNSLFLSWFNRISQANIGYDTNILGEAPRTFKVTFYDFLEKKVRKFSHLKLRNILGESHRICETEI